MGDLFFACLGGDLPLVRKISAEVTDPEEQISALAGAAAQGYAEVVKFLLDEGVPHTRDSFAENPDGYPLHAAVTNDKPQSVALLLKAGAAPDVLNAYNQTPFYFARSAAVARLLLDAGADPTAGHPQPLHRAARAGREEVVRELLSHPGVHPDGDVEAHGTTPLQDVVIGGIPSGVGCVAALLAAGADPCALDHRGWTALKLCDLTDPEEALFRSPFIIGAMLVAAGDRQWDLLPTPCPYLEKALMPVWKDAPEELGELFKHLEPEIQECFRETLRALHHGGLDLPLKMMVLEKVFPTE